MKNKTIILALLLCGVTTAFSQTKNSIWFNEPAQLFEEAFPIGNGKMGAMIYGKTDIERISLNDATLWSGKPIDPNMNPEAKNYLPKVREALFNENYRAADSLMRFMQGTFSASYAPLGNLWMILVMRISLIIKNAIYNKPLLLFNIIMVIRFTENVCFLSG
jgi:alpha-L-fucosidase 2